ncbi:MAG: hypothetical protein ABJM58_08070 [Alteripontixanthobacter sp.]
MAESSFASLNPTLLARKGGAKPAMRPQLGALSGMATGMEAGMVGAQQAAFPIDDGQLDDLGWNDMGEDQTPSPAEVVLITPAAANEAGEPRQADAPVQRQHDEISQRFSKNAEAPRAARQTRRTAFTLRMDAERHLRLRLASTIENRSAQAIVTEALDAFLASIPELEQLAAKVERK